jgi:hypothetical protein
LPQSFPFLATDLVLYNLEASTPEVRHGLRVTQLEPDPGGGNLPGATVQTLGASELEVRAHPRPPRIGR